MIRIPDYVSTLSPYKAGNQVEKRDFKSPFGRIINLASNENPLGGSPKAHEAIIGNLDKLALYPEPFTPELTAKLAQIHGRDAEEIVCGHGSESLIAHIVNAFSDVGDEVVTAAATFVGIFVKTHKQGRIIKRIPLKHYGYDLKAILGGINERSRIVYLANPNNPTGTMFTDDEFEDFMNSVPDNTIVVLDEAYYSYSKKFSNYPDGQNYRYPNMINLRTFSKTHGLAGLRVGYAIGPEDLIGVIRKVKLPFEPSIISQLAAAAAVDDKEFVEKSVKINSISLKMMMQKFDEYGIEYPEPFANFLMILLQNQDLVKEFCTESYIRGVLVRNLAPFGMPNGVRISTGTLAETEYAVKVFEDVLTILESRYKFQRK